MIRIKNVHTLAEKSTSIELKGQDCLIDAENKLTLLPALITPCFHTHSWLKYCKELINNGITTVIEKTDTTDKAQVLNKIKEMETLFENVKILLNYNLHLLIAEDNLEEIGKVKKIIKGVIFDPSIIKTDSFWEKAFQMAAIEELPIIFDSNHSLDEIKRGIALTEEYSGQLLFTNTIKTEVFDLVANAKERELLVYCEALIDDQPTFWKRIKSRTIDMLGFEINNRTPFPFLPLLLNASHEKKITLDEIVSLTKTNIELIFNFQPTEDYVLVDLNKTKEVSMRNGKITLQGWPIYTLIKGQVLAS